jgi:serpin B
MKSIIKSITCLAFLLLSGCDKQDSSISKDPIKLTSEQKQLVSSSNSFGFNIFKEVAANSKDGDNVFISPLSMSLALSMLYNGAETETREELQNGLGFTGLTDEQINVANRDLIKALMKADPKVAMEIANSIWYRNTFSVEPSFLAVNKDYLNAEVRSASFDAATVGLINSWVRTKTHEKIKTIVDQIDTATVMYLINAIYFKGVWQYKFDSQKTQKMDFTLFDGSKKQTDFMVQEGSFEYLQNELLTAVNLPYGDGSFSMMALVPREDKTYKDILAAMNDQNWSIWNNSLQKINKVKIYLPKFKFSYKRKLNNDLINLGMPAMFSDAADLTRINRNGNLVVSNVLHKSFVEVNEEGTEAAAVTSIEIELTSVGPESPMLKADKPFIFIIKEKNSNSLLFMGVMNEPLVEN